MKKFMATAVLIFIFVSTILAQDGELLDTENGPAPGDVPVDGGISFLLAAGVAYGASRWKKAKENE
jgi:hypothetical protein